MEYSPKKMKEKIDEKNFKFKKKFGQNFIVDANIIENIVSKSEILPNSLVIEVGPGAGSLTACIAKYAKQVLCFEIDTEVKEILEENTKEFNNNTPLDLKGWSPLIRKYTTSGGADYPVLLYLPANSSDFVIIRK